MRFMKSFLCGSVAWLYAGHSSAQEHSYLAEQVYNLVGDHYGDYLTADTSLSNAIMTAMGGPPDAVRRTSGGNLQTACRLHSCDERAAVFWGDDKTVRSVGLIHFNCSRDESRPRACLNDPMLTLVSRHNDPAAGTAIIAWARANAEITTIERLER